MNIEAGIETGAVDNLYMLKVRMYRKSLILSLILDAVCTISAFWILRDYWIVATALVTAAHMLLYRYHYSSYLEVYLYNDFLVINHPFRLFSRIKLIQYNSIKVLSLKSWNRSSLPAQLSIMYYEDCMKKRYDTKWHCPVDHLGHMISYLRDKGMKVAVGSFQLKRA
ncbi:MAG: hypothetical protein EOP56_02355 [Sphingobacteriales bacterium]|nr:MAG: hypothetical protein EOP56_02355 [Sphingobacteriales bacterium]